MRSIAGVITVVQEQRFLLATDSGPPRHFVLAHGTSLDHRELTRLSENGVRVAVQYDDAPGLVAYVARKLLTHKEKS